VRNRPAAIVAALALIATLGFVVAITSWNGKLPALTLAGRECVVSADGQVTLDSAQMANAATISAVGVRRQMPERAIVIALAAAFQESHLENRDDGDRDSVGLFQQRPSQGWGSPAKLQDPRYAAGRFYSALKKVNGWRSMRVTEAAQKVQRSAYPNAYEKWADQSAVLTRALLGHAVGAVACTFSGKPAVRGQAAATALVNGLRLDWGSGLATGSAAATGLTVDVPDARAGWRYAHWLVSHASENGVERVRFGGLQWHAPTGDWEPGGDQPAGGTQVVAEVFG
jgi:hypothetical protein